MLQVKSLLVQGDERMGRGYSASRRQGLGVLRPGDQPPSPGPQPLRQAMTTSLEKTRDTGEYGFFQIPEPRVLIKPRQELPGL